MGSIGLHTIRNIRQLSLEY